MTDETEILNLIKQLYETLFRKQSVISQAEAGEFLKNLSTPNLLEEHINFLWKRHNWKGFIWLTEKYKNDKSPGNERVLWNLPEI